MYDDELRKWQQAQFGNRAQAQPVSLSSQMGSLAAQQKPKGGFLSQIIGGIGEKIGDVGSTLNTMGKTLVGGLSAQSERDKIKQLREEDSQRRNSIAKQFGYNSYSDAMNDANASPEFWKAIKGSVDTAKSAQAQNEQARQASYGNVRDIDLNKAKGQALSTIGTVVDVMPGGGVVGNALSGAIEGVGDAYKSAQGGGVVDPQEALINALAGTGGALAGGMGGKLARNIAPQHSGLVADALRSGLGGAMAGGAAGAIQAGGRGQDALEGALRGAQGGFGAGALMGGAGSVASAVKNKNLGMLKDQYQSDSASTGDVTGWGGKDMTLSAQKQRGLKKVGNKLQEVGQATKDNSVYGKLKGNTAEEMQRKGAIENLRKNYGYDPDSYQQAANLSEVANKWYADKVENSNATKVMPDLHKRLMGVLKDEEGDIILDDKHLARFNERINNAIEQSTVNKDGMAINNFGAVGLEKSARDLGRLAKSLETTSQGGSKKANDKFDVQDEALAKAYTKAKNILRDEVDGLVGFSDADKGNLRAALEASGAPQKAIDKIMSAKSMKEVKRFTSPLEDARTMYNQMQSSGIKRGANADNSTNIINQVANASGAGQLLSAAVQPVGKVVGSVEKGVGKALSSVGGKDGITSRLRQDLQDTGNYLKDLDLNEVAQERLSNPELLAQRAIVSEAMKPYEEAPEEAPVAVSGNELAMSQALGVAPMQAQMPVAQVNPLDSQVAMLTNAMGNALAAGDVQAYGQIANMLEQAQSLQAKLGGGAGAPQLSAEGQKNMAKLATAGNALDSLERLYSEAGGGQGRIGGTIANLGSALGLNDDVSVYNDLSEGLINQIAASVGKTDALNNEGEVQRALSLVPKITDNAEEAQKKLAELRRMLEVNTSTYGDIYGA